MYSIVQWLIQLNYESTLQELNKSHLLFISQEKTCQTRNSLNEETAEEIQNNELFFSSKHRRAGDAFVVGWQEVKVAGFGVRAD